MSERTVLNKNCFIFEEKINEVSWYHYHPLWRDYLRSLSKPADWSDRLPQLATAYTTDKNWYAAHDIYHEMGDMDAIADLIEMAGYELFKNGHQTKLLTWINSLSKDLLDDRAKITSLKGIIETNLGNPTLGLMLQNQAIEKFRQENQIGDLVTGLAWRAVSHRFLGDYQASLNDADEGLNLTKGESNSQEANARGCRAKALEIYHLQQANKSLDWFKKSLELYQSLKEDDWAALVAQDIGVVYEHIWPLP